MVPASVHEIDLLMDRVRQEQLSQARSLRQAGDAPYIAHKPLVEAFQEFVQAGSKVLVIVGNSGHGKSTWCYHLLQTPLDDFTVHLIRADDILDSDSDVVGTITRYICGRPLKGISSHDIQQSCWNWVDAANRLIVVDGLDRVTTAVRDVLHTWLRNTAHRTAEMPVRFVLTSRPDAWATFSARVPEIAHYLHSAAEASTATVVALPLLDDAQARQLYEAYGLDPNRHGRRLLRTPSLISTFASLRARMPEGVTPTRLDIFEARVKEAMEDVARRTNLGEAGKNALIKALGSEIAQQRTARLPIVELERKMSTDQIDELVRANLLAIIGDDVRPEPDEVLEYLWGRFLDPAVAIENLKGQSDDDIFIGAIAISIALLERRNPRRAAEIIDALIAKGFIRAAARAIVELADHAAAEPQIHTILSAWKKPNFLLDHYGLVEMIDALRLPVDGHLRSVLLLADQEDKDG
jgi:hypothetical protein